APALVSDMARGTHVADLHAHQYVLFVRQRALPGRTAQEYGPDLHLRHAHLDIALAQGALADVGPTIACGRLPPLAGSRRNHRLMRWGMGRYRRMQPPAPQEAREKHANEQDHEAQPPADD